MKVEMVDNSVRDMFLTNDCLVFGSTTNDQIIINLSNKEKQDLTTMLLGSLYADQQKEVITSHLNRMDIRDFEETMKNVVEYTSNVELEDRVLALSEQVENLEDTLEQFEEYSQPIYRQEIF
jgi:hypothetical protein